MYYSNFETFRGGKKIEYKTTENHYIVDDEFKDITSAAVIEFTWKSNTTTERREFHFRAIREKKSVSIGGEKKK